ncbi:MAG: hypothetical protein M0C28_03740 [Candidatus Moduliflexus flocculans]|nr:hypothetical protein [Candidatus Moduliflexus flocculans]
MIDEGRELIEARRVDILPDDVLVRPVTSVGLGEGPGRLIDRYLLGQRLPEHGIACSLIGWSVPILGGGHFRHLYVIDSLEITSIAMMTRAMSIAWQIDAIKD